MSKNKEEYRGQDRTLELVRTKYNEMLGDDGIHFDEHAWDIAVERVYCDFVAEGLFNSANEVMKHQTENYLKHVHEPWVKITDEDLGIKAPKEFTDIISNPEIGYVGEAKDTDVIHTERCGICGFNKIIGKPCASGCIIH